MPVQVDDDKDNPTVTIGSSLVNTLPATTFDMASHAERSSSYTRWNEAKSAQVLAILSTHRVPESSLSEKPAVVLSCGTWAIYVIGQQGATVSNEVWQNHY